MPGFWVGLRGNLRFPSTRKELNCIPWRKVNHGIREESNGTPPGPRYPVPGTQDRARSCLRQNHPQESPGAGSWPSNTHHTPPARQEPENDTRRPTGRRAPPPTPTPDPRRQPAQPPAPEPTLSLIRAGGAAAEGMSAGEPGPIVGLTWGDVEAGFEAAQHVAQPLSQPLGATSDATSSATGVPPAQSTHYYLSCGRRSGRRPPGGGDPRKPQGTNEGEDVEIQIADGIVRRVRGGQDAHLNPFPSRLGRSQISCPWSATGQEQRSSTTPTRTTRGFGSKPRRPGRSGNAEWRRPVPTRTRVHRA